MHAHEMKEDDLSASMLEQALQAHRQGDLAKAKRLYESLLEQNPHHTAILCNLGLVHKHAKAYDEAVHYLQRAHEADPSNTAIMGNLINLYVEQSLFDKAIETAKEMIGRDHENAIHYEKLAWVYETEGSLNRAVVYYQKALEIGSGKPETYLKLAALLFAQGEFIQAGEIIEEGLKADPKNTLLLTAKGKVALQLDEMDEAVQAFKDAIVSDEKNVEAHYMLAIGMLQSGRFKEGFSQYRWRLYRPGMSRYLNKIGTILQKPAFRKKESAGNDAVLVYSGESLWSDLLMLRYLRIFKERYPDNRLLFYTSGALKPLLHMTGEIDGLYCDDEIPEQFDSQIGLMDLPELLGVDVEHIPDPSGALKVPDIAIERDDTLLHVGLVWSGERGMHRGVRLLDFAPLMLHPNLRLHALEPSPAIGDIAAFGLEEEDIATYANLHSDIVMTAALIERLDLVITADSFIADLAALLGKQTWVLADEKVHWRWLANDSRSIWYPTVKCFPIQHSALAEALLEQIENDYGIELKRRKVYEAV